MPNWCSNRMTVTGDPEEVDRFAVRVARGMTPERVAAAAEMISERPGQAPEIAAGLEGEHTVLTFDEHVPQPTFPPGSEAWYPWRTRHWGTKWDACRPVLERSTDGARLVLCYSFDTAWSPPAAWFEAVARAHPELSMTLLWNEKQRIAGWFRAEDGQLSGGGCEDPAELVELGWPDPPYLGNDDWDDDWDEPAHDEEAAPPVAAPSGT